MARNGIIPSSGSKDLIRQRADRSQIYNGLSLWGSELPQAWAFLLTSAPLHSFTLLKIWLAILMLPGASRLAHWRREGWNIRAQIHKYGWACSYIPCILNIMCGSRNESTTIDYTVYDAVDILFTCKRWIRHNAMWSLVFYGYRVAQTCTCCVCILCMSRCAYRLSYIWQTLLFNEISVLFLTF